MLVVYWTRTWWPGVDDERVKEGKRLVFPGLLAGFHAPGDQPEIDRKRGREREKERKKERPKL